MNAAEADVQEYSFHSMFLSRLSGFPIVKSAMGVTSHLYENVKDSSFVVSYTLTKGEIMAGRIVAKAGRMMVTGPCLKHTDNLADKALERVQSFFPVLAKPTQEISASAKLQIDNTKARVHQLLDPIVKVTFDIRDNVSRPVTIVQESRLVQFLITVQESVENEQTRIIANVTSLFYGFCERAGVLRAVKVCRKLLDGLKERGLHFIAETRVLVQKSFPRISAETYATSSSVMRFYYLASSRQFSLMMHAIWEPVSRFSLIKKAAESVRAVNETATEEMRSSNKDD